MSNIEIALIVIGGIAGYLVTCSLAYVIVPDSWRDNGHDNEAAFFAAAFWPIALAGWIAWRLVTIGPRIIERRRRPKLPRAEVRR